ncbi:Protein CBG22268 [Caenorhabditis briggsae]|uniref:Protein CBG22268 n=1 Tax=Caenorhabditis briggsae TaxID=6238 RepID=A8Y1X9_CAEBR|nr:Protein CBG22268 [Caenorhabditis briggsae]CAP38899.2 Protein CBG22268 [Caenorhabditis briggsae]
MTTEQHQQYTPEHTVPVLLEDIADTKTDTIQFGKVSLVRIQLRAIVESIRFNDSDAEYIVTNEARTHRMMVQKIYTPAFPRSRCEEFIVSDNVAIFGKIRVKEDGTAFINALGLNVIGWDENTAALPTNQSSVAHLKLGLHKKTGDVSRFPIDLLEPSAALENNGGVWPSEIEDLAAGLVVKKAKVEEESSSDEEEDSDGSDEEETESEDSEEGEEEEDSFDAGPAALVQEESQVLEDSFDAGPTTTIPEAAEKPKQEEEVVFDSFENA